MFKKIAQEDVLKILDRHRNNTPITFKEYDLSRLDFSNRTIESINFVDCNLTGTNFNNTIVKKAEFKNGLLIGSNFQKADLCNVDFVNCAMQKINLSHVRIEGVGIKESNLVNAIFKKVNIEFSNLNIFKNVNLNNADFNDTTISWLSSENVSFINSTFKNASILESYLKNCTFTNSSFEKAILYSVAFVDCKMQKSTLANATVTNVTFKESNLESANFEQSEIEYSNFTDSNLNGTNFKKAILNSMNEFKNVTLLNADFTQTSFSHETNLHDNDLSVSKGLEPITSNNLIYKSQPSLQPKQSRTALEEYQYQITLFTTQYLNGQVNAEVDCKIAQTMIEQNHLHSDIETAIIFHSPNAPKLASRAKTYALNILKRAEKDRKIR